jgi:predicted RNA-binding Zn-ribbon protein involved in translation (DUF1610 family)
VTTKRPRAPSIPCPHCGSRAIVRSSEQITELYRELRLSCDNFDCRHTFVASLSVIRTIHPSAIPNPAIVIPTKLRERPANDDSVPANDNPETPEAASSG